MKESNDIVSRLSAQVVYRSHRSELGSDIKSGQANFYLVKLSVS